MSHFEKNIFSQLISNTDFIRWAKGKEVENPSVWEEWKSKNPENKIEFDEAVRLTNELTTNPSPISELEVQYLWQKASDRMSTRRELPKVRKLMNSIMKVAAILFIPLFLYVGIDLFKKTSNDSGLLGFYQDDAQEITIVAPIGARSMVNLPDGSKVWLNSGTKLIYPSLFSESERKVRIEGEAYFSIEKNRKPFIVENFGPSIKVYGTEFNVSSYADDRQVIVALVEGKISMNVNQNEQFLEPGQVSFYNKSQKEIIIKDDDIEQFICWKEGRHIFRNTPLSSIARVLQRQYNITFEFEAENVASYKYNAQFQDESLEQILELLQLSAPIQYTYIKRDTSDDGESIKGKVIIKKITELN